MCIQWLSDIVCLDICSAHNITQKSDIWEWGGGVRKPCRGWDKHTSTVGRSFCLICFFVLVDMWHLPEGRGRKVSVMGVRGLWWCYWPLSEVCQCRCPYVGVVLSHLPILPFHHHCAKSWTAVVWGGGPDGGPLETQSSPPCSINVKGEFSAWYCSQSPLGSP